MTETFYDNLIPDSLNFVFFLDLSGTIGDIKSFGSQQITPDITAYLGRSLNDILSFVDATWNTLLTQMLTSGNSVSFERKLLLPEPRWFEVSLMPIKCDDENVESIRCIFHDIDRFKISELNIMPSRLQNSKASRIILRQITDNLSEIVISQIDRQGSFNYISPTITTILGYSPDEIIGTSVFDLLHPEDLIWVRQMLQGDPLNLVWGQLEFRFRHKNGDYLWFEAMGRSNIMNEFIDGAIFASREISARKKAEEALIASEARFRNITDNMMDMIAQVTVDGIYEYVSPSYKSAMGLEPEELIGTSCFKRVHPDDYDDAVAVFKKSHAEGAPGKCEYRFADANDNYIWFESVGSPLFNDKGELIAAILGSRDISERKIAEEHLELTRVVFENINEGIVVADHEQTILSVNPAFTAITGIKSEEAVGCKLTLLQNEVFEGDPETLESINSSMISNNRWSGTIECRNKNGQLFVIELSAKRINYHNNRLSREVIIFRDITEKVRLREESQRLHEKTSRAEKMASMSAMSAGIVHEIAQPLNSIKVLADSVLYWNNRGQPLETSKVIQKLTTISSQAGRIDDIIRHMRSFAIAGGTSEMSPCNLNQSITGALNILGRQIASHGITVKSTMWPDLPDVNANPNRLEEVVINLLVNAMHSLDQIDKIDKVIECRTGIKSNQVWLEVSDNGTGIPDHIMGCIFEPFYSTKQSGEGMGLGLTIVQTVVTSFNGTIEAFNNRTEGAVFRIELPIHRF